MAHIPFLLEPKFNINPVLQQTFRLPPVRSFPINLSSANNNAFKLNYSSVIRYSPNLRTQCFSTSPKPKGENGIGGIGGWEDNDLKELAISSGIQEVLWRSITIALIALQKSLMTGVLLGSLLLYDHHRGCVALAASGGRMGGSSFSSSSKSSKSSSSTSSSRSSSLSSSSSKSPSISSSSSSKSRPSYSSSSSSSKRPSYSSSSTSSSKSPSYSSTSSTSSSKGPSYSSSSPTSSSRSPSYSSSSPTSSSKSPSYSSSWSTSSSESPPYYSSRSRSSSTRTKPSFSSYQSSKPSEGGGSAVGVAPAFGAGPIIACAMIVVALGLAPEILSRTLLAQKTSVLKLQVGLSGTVRSLQRDLNRIAETADTSSPQGLYYILQETTRALLQYPDSCISGYSSVDAKKSIVDVEKLFNQLCIEERGKFDEETLVNVNNIKKQSAPTKKSNDVRNEYIVITIVVAADGVHKLPPINSSAKLKEALQKLMTIPSSGIKAVEVLWTPQNENDILTEQEYIEDYSLLRPL